MFSFRLGDEVTNSVRIVLKDRGWRDVSRRRSKSRKRAVGSRRDCHVELRTYRFKESEYAAAHASGGATKLNHFPRTSDITQKDKLTRHLRRMQVVHGSTYSFFPESFILPRERTQFEQAFAAAAAQTPAHASSASGSNKTLWICKPSASSQGRGIFLIDDLKDVVYDSPYVVQRYLADPYLIGGYKFDIRLYVLVNSFRPLEIFLYRRGLARFGTQKYEGASIDKLFAHLTNASINKHNRAEFGADKDVIGAGSKWTLPRLFAHLRDEGGMDVVALWARHVRPDECFLAVGVVCVLHALLMPRAYCFPSRLFDLQDQGNRVADHDDHHSHGAGQCGLLRALWLWYGSCDLFVRIKCMGCNLICIFLLSIMWIDSMLSQI